jgi:hypothetical protein
MSNMRKLLMGLMTFLFITSAWSLKIDSRRKQLLEIVNEELREVIRLNRQIGSRNPNLLLRMAELYLEKARIIKDLENREFISTPPDERQNINRKDFFLKSRKYFINAQKTCYYILKRFKRFKGRADVFYILAYNAKEFQQNDKAKVFFQKSIKSSGGDSYTRAKSKLALAEMYYNQKKYKRAIPLYEGALKKRNQKWWTKDAYNLSWCYFRAGYKSKAIKTMKTVYDLSSNPKYVDVRDLVSRDLAYFYSDVGNTTKAIAFYKSIGKDIGKNLFRVGKYLKGQGRSTSAEKSLSEALKYTESLEAKVDINTELLSIYEKFGKIKKHLKVCQELHGYYKKGLLSPKQLEDLKFHVGKMSALLQKQVVSKAYRTQKRVQRFKAKNAVAYFKILSDLQKDKDYLSIFHAAETQYAVKKYDDAIGLYDRSYEAAKIQKNSKIQKLALDGMMASLGGKGVSKKNKDKFLIKVYNIFLTRYPQSKKSFKIYQRLFSAYNESKKISEAESILFRFRQSFPKAISKQEAMLANIMDYYKDKNDKMKVKLWVKRINEGEFVVSKNYAKKLRLLLLSMEFDKVEKFNTKGEKVEALRGYLAIYKDPRSSKDAKRNSAYNIAVLFHELNYKNKTYDWTVRALDLMRAKQVKKFEQSFLLIASSLYSQREFSKSADLNKRVFNKLCSIKSRNKEIFYKNTNILYLAEGMTSEAESFSNSARKCGVPLATRIETSLDILKGIGEQQRWQSFSDRVLNLLKTSQAWPNLIYPLSQLRDAYYRSGNTSLATKTNLKLLSLYKKCKARGLKIPLEGLDIVAINKFSGLNSIRQQLRKEKMAFPENVYNKRLKRKFSLLDKLTIKASEILNIGSGRGLTYTYSILIQSYRDLANEIKFFTPPGKSPEYIKSFKKSMRDLAGPISNKANDFAREAKSQLMRNQILSEDNYYILGSQKLAITPIFFPRKKGVLMDKGGKR